MRLSVSSVFCSVVLTVLLGITLAIDSPVILGSSAPAPATHTLVVTSAEDSGPGTLRQALSDAGRGDVIVFEPAVFSPTSPATITLTSGQLPDLDDGNVTVDASNTGVILDGSALSGQEDGLYVRSDGNVIKGLQIVRFPGDGIEIAGGAKYNTIGGDSTIGGGPHGEGNVITLNEGTGININGPDTTDNIISGNLIGLDVDGTLDIHMQAISVSPDYADDHTVFIGTRSHGFWRTSDSGGSWVSASIGLTNLDVRALAVSPNYDADNILFAGTANGGIFRTTDGGSLWIQVDGGVTGRDIRSLAISPDYANDGRLYASTDGDGVFASTDGGNTWIARNEGLTDGSVLLVISPDYVADHALFATNGNRVYRWSGDGHTWMLVSSDAISGVRVMTPSPNFASDHTILAGVSAPPDTCGTSGVSRSTDGGRSWTLISGNPGWCDIWSLAISPNYAVDQTLYAGDWWSGVYESTDGGSTWHAVWNDYFPQAVVAISPTYGQDQTLFVGTQFNGMFRSADGGESWIEANSGLTERGNQAGGVIIAYGAERNTIGGDTSGERNIISNNTNNAISIYGPGTMNNVVMGNYIGTDADGMHPLGNSGDGVRIIGASFNVVGGTNLAECNVISGQRIHSAQVDIGGTGADHNVVSGNYIGTDASGSRVLDAFGYGVYVESGAQHNIIGGATPGERNVISGVGGVIIAGSGAMSNTVVGNFIGTDASGTVALGGGGVGIGESSYNRIGGSSASERNVISGNSGPGVSLNGQAAMYNTISGNYIGVDVTGAKALPNQSHGVILSDGASYNHIGGAAEGERNIISGNNADGVNISGSDTMSNTVYGNYIGVDVSGTSMLGNGGDGVRIDARASRNLVGGTTPQERNVVSGNGWSGISMGGQAADNVVIGNYVGTDVSGMKEIGNGQGNPGAGVAIYGSAHHNRIGGGASAERNVISGNNGVGVAINLGIGSDHNLVQGNYIGVDASGAGPLGNTWAGVYVVEGASDNLIGGATLAEGNLIAHNVTYGIFLSGSDTLSNTISHNSIYSNGDRGIELTEGGNLELAPPVITSVIAGSTVNGTACPGCTIEIFSDDEDQGRIYEGTTLADGVGFWSLTNSPALAGPHFTATATDAQGNTSEFSIVPYMRVNTSSDWVDGQLATRRTQVQGALLDHGGRIKGHGSSSSNDQGWITPPMEFYDGQNARVAMVTGDIISLTVGTGIVITAEVIPIVGDVDIASDTIVGRVPTGIGGRPTWAEIVELPESPEDVRGTLEVDGSYALHFGNFDIRDGHQVTAWYREPGGNWIGIVRHWLFIDAQVGGSSVEGATSPGAEVQIDVVDNSGYIKGRGTATADTDGDYQVSVWDGGQPVAILPGDAVAATAGNRSTQTSVPALTGVMDFDADAVCGMGPPGSQVYVRLGTETGRWSQRSPWTHVDDSGRYCVGLGFDLRSGYQGEVVYCTDLGHRMTAPLTSEIREVTPLALGVSATGSAKSLGYTDYSVEVGDGERLVFEVAPMSDIGQVWLYGKFGSLPSRTRYDFQALRPTADGIYQLLIVPTRAGAYYFSVFGWDVPSGQGSFTVMARVLDRHLADVQPRSAGNTGEVTLLLRGMGFVESMRVELRSAGSPVIAATSLMQASYTSVSARFNLLGVAPGLYDVVAIWPGGEEEMMSAVFEVFASTQGARLEASLDAPDFVRPGRTFVLWLDYANTGDVDMTAPLFIVSSPISTPLRLAETEPFEGKPVQVLGINPDGLAGSLPPGTSGRIPVYFQVPADTPGHAMLRFDLASMISDTLPIDWIAVEAEVRPPDLDAQVWAALWPALKAQIGNTWGDYRLALANDASYLSALGRAVYSVRDLFRFEVRKALGMNPRQVLAAELDADCPAPGLALRFGRVFPGGLEGRFHAGPLGRGWSHSYDVYLVEQSNGDILVHLPGSFTRLFRREADGSYGALPGDYGRLTCTDGIYQLVEKNGITYGFRADRQLDYLEDRNGNRITATYEASGHLTRVQHSNGDHLDFAYDAQGHLSRLTDCAGRATEYYYDASGEHLTGVSAPGSRVTSYAYSAPTGQPEDHALLIITYPDGRHQYYSYDELGRLSDEHLDADAERVSYSYDSFGRIVATDSAGQVLRMSPDEQGRPTKLRDALGRELGQQYSPEDDLVSVTDPAGQSYRFDYDLQGNVIGTENPEGQQIKLDYDYRFNQVNVLQDARDNGTSFSYDTMGNLAAIVYPDGSQETFTYDAAGNPIQYSDRAGKLTRYTFNTKGQLLRKDYPDGSWAAYTYDAAGNMTSASDGQGMIQMQYDPNTNWLTRIAYPSGHWFAFTYDPVGRRTRRDGDDGYRLNYFYDAAGRLARLTDGADAEIVRYGYDDAGRLVRETKGNGTYTTYEYDAAGQIVHLLNYAPGGEVQSRFEYTCNANGNRTSMTTLDGTTAYEYDLIGQLTGVTYPNGRHVTYSYDAAGNRTVVTDDGTPTVYTTNALNQYTRVGVTTYTYDANGNLASKTDATGTTAYAYDFEKRLVRVTTPVSGTWEYTYDALGNRVAVSHDGIATTYIHDPIGIVDVAAEYSGNGALLARYVHGAGLVARVDPAGQGAYYAFDATGHTRQVTDAAGTTVNDYDYDPFGVPYRSSESMPNPYRYVGRHGALQQGNDETVYMRFRYYQPEIARFLSEEPFTVPTASTYLYVSNNPLDYVDPAGLHEEDTNYPGDYSRDIRWDYSDLGENSPLQYDPTPIIKKGGPEYSPAPADDYWNDPLHPIRPDPNDPLTFWDPYFLPTTGNDVDTPTPIIVVVGQDGPENITSNDPNEKLGPAGHGLEMAVLPGEELHYVVYFENQPEASAPAQEVFISDNLDPDLDWSTFRPTEIAWGDKLLVVPAETGAWSARQTVGDYRSGIGKAWWVDVTVAPDYQSGRVMWTLRTLDPQTGGLPSDPLAGFLPPNDATGRGEGHVAFSIRSRADSPDGTVLTNRATITFDTNPAITTNEVGNVVRYAKICLPIVLRNVFSGR